MLLNYFLIILSVFLSFIFSITSVIAQTNPIEVPNNKYGIHIINENDLENASKLVNSNGGDWGYVKLVITLDDRNINKWNQIFESMEKYHLIPIIRVATRSKNAYWEKPKLEDINSWVDFLDSLNWFTKNRYIILFNEPNHSKEWGGGINPTEYAKIFVEYTQKLKAKNSYFYLLNAGLDASCSNTQTTMDETLFLNEINNQYPIYFSILDGWNSHSYPNPNFQGSVFAQGRGTLESYKWELKYLNNLGISKNFPIFITETGWMHSDGQFYNPNLLSPQKVAENITIAADIIWKDDSIVTLIPFLLNYQSYPFDHFSWQKFNSNDFHPIYYAFQNISKINGKPELVNDFKPAPTITTPLLLTEINDKSYLEILFNQILKFLFG